MITEAPANKAMSNEFSARKEVPYSPSRVYLPRVSKLDNNRELNTLPSGRRYVRMDDGSLRRVVKVQKVEEPI